MIVDVTIWTSSYNNDSGGSEVPFFNNGRALVCTIRSTALFLSKVMPEVSKNVSFRYLFIKKSALYVA